ncbi:MAG TPA: hypothetical protein VNW92_13845 [Polyangiaceae bacterium]|nr:hypothetical protein [Polyangiaceae bacterium]
MGLFAAKVARLSRGLAACAVLCALALTAASARAEETHPTLLAYRAPTDCPPVGDFQRSVQRRSARIHFVDEGSHDRELAISLRKDGDFTVGELRLIEANGTLRQRSVRFGTCAEAVEGLALIATVSLDPQALLEGPIPAPETPPAPPPPTSPPPPAAKQNLPPPAPPAKKAPELEARVGAEFNVYFNALPKPAPGGSVFFDIGSNSRHWLAPLLHVVIISHAERWSLPEASPGARAEANFALTLATVSGCPLRIGDGSWGFRPCASVSAGALHSWSTKTDDTQPRTRPYVSWGGTGIVFVRLGELLEIVGDAGVGVTVIRDTFTFGNCSGLSGADCTQVLKTPALYMSSGLGLSLLLP